MLQFRLFRFILGDSYNPGGQSVMPKCEVDLALQDRVQRFISDSGLTINAAAVNLGINRTTFWRFCDTGKASPKTKVRLRGALEKRNNRSAEDVSVYADDSDSPATQAPAVLGLLADRELNQIRRACEGVLALINVYEARHAVRKIRPHSIPMTGSDGEG